MVRVCQECPATAVDVMAQHLAAERRRVWNRAIMTMEYFVGKPPEPVHQRQMEYHEDYEARQRAYAESMRQYHHELAVVDILRERLALEEPPCDEAQKHQEFQDS